MNQKVNLNKLKEEIDTRKKQKSFGVSNPDENGSGIEPRHAFLHKLLESVKTGKETVATSIIKEVTNTAAKKSGDKLVHKPSNIPSQRMQPRTPEMSPERDEQLYRDLEIKKNQTLGEAIQNFSGSKNVDTQHGNTINFNGQELLTSIPKNSLNTLENVNEDVLVNSVKKIVNNHLVENLSPVLDEAIKSTIIEMYAVERIKEVLTENRELLKEVVYEVIREIKNKSTNK